MPQDAFGLGEILGFRLCELAQDRQRQLFFLKAFRHLGLLGRRRTTAPRRTGFLHRHLENAAIREDTMVLFACSLCIRTLLKRNFIGNGVRT